MSDVDLRDLERRFRETGSVEDEATWLRARVQAGELEQGRLDLAAYLCDPASLAAQRDRLPNPRGWESWLAALRADPNARVVLNALSSISPPATCSDLRSCVEGELKDEVVWSHGEPDALRVVLSRLAETGLVKTTDLGDQGPVRISPRGTQWLESNRRVSDNLAHLRACLSLLLLSRPAWEAQDPGNWRPRKVCETLEEFLLCPCEACWGGWLFWHKGRFTLTDAREYLRDLARGDALVRARVRDEVVPWALGYRDPVHERVEARKREAGGG